VHILPWQPHEYNRVLLEKLIISARDTDITEKAVGWSSLFVRCKHSILRESVTTENGYPCFQRKLWFSHLAIM